MLKDEDLRKKYDKYGEKGLQDEQQGGRYESWNYYRYDFGESESRDVEGSQEDPIRIQCFRSMNIYKNNTDTDLLVKPINIQYRDGLFLFEKFRTGDMVLKVDDSVQLLSE